MNHLRHLERALRRNPPSRYWHIINDYCLTCARYKRADGCVGCKRLLEIGSLLALWNRSGASGRVIMSACGDYNPIRVDMPKRRARKETCIPASR